MTALRTIIAAGDPVDLKAADISLGDYSYLNDSHRWLVILDYQGFRREREALDGLHAIVWRVDATLLVPYNNDAQVYEDASELRAGVMDAIAENPSLGISAFNAEVKSGDAIDAMIQPGDISWSLEILHIEVEEDQPYDEVD